MKKAFDKIKLSQIHILCNTIADTEVRHISNVKRKYLENALAFDETLSFLQDLKVIKITSDELVPLKPISLSHYSLNDFKSIFLPLLFSANGGISKDLREFLVNFKTDTENIFFRASELEKIKFSDTRNLLLELNFISTGNDNATYFINPEYSALFINHFSKRTLSPEAFKKKQEKNNSIGLMAEKAVIAYELERLTAIKFEQKEIEHISQKNVLAGYDIKSFENYLDKNSKRIDRYIEVKAVSADDYKFYWSKNEIEIAKVFGEMYYLYLLPVSTNNTFDFYKLIIKKNPFNSIYSNELEWQKNEESISFIKFQTK